MKTFDDWFYEIENYGMRSERFLSECGMDFELFKRMVPWLQAAYLVGRTEGDMIADLNMEITMKPKTYRLLEQCIETGIRLGWDRAHKHTDEPDEIWIKNQIEQAIMNEIAEWFDFEEKEL